MKMTIRITLTQEEYNIILDQAMAEDIHSMGDVAEMMQDQIGEALWNVGYEAETDVEIEVI